MSDNGKSAEELEDVLLVPSVPAAQGEASQDRETVLLTGQPVKVFETPQGNKLPVYPKPQGYFYKIEEAVNHYLEALAKYDRRAQKPTRPRFWWYLKRRRDIDRIEQSKFRLLTLIFEDQYNPERHTDLTVDEFLGLPHDTVLAILDAYREANHVDQILRRLIPDWDKKKALQDAVMQSFTRI